MESLFKDYFVVIAIVIFFCFKNKIFISPSQVEEKIQRMKEQILEKIKGEYATKEFISTLKEDITQMKDQLDTIMQYILNQK